MQNMFEPKTGFLPLAIVGHQDCEDGWLPTGLMPQLYAMFTKKICPPEGFTAAYNGQFLVSRKRLRALDWWTYHHLLVGVSNPNVNRHLSCIGSCACDLHGNVQFDPSSLSEGRVLSAGVGVCPPVALDPQDAQRCLVQVPREPHVWPRRRAGLGTGLHLLGPLEGTQLLGVRQEGNEELRWRRLPVLGPSRRDGS